MTKAEPFIGSWGIGGNGSHRALWDPFGLSSLIAFEFLGLKAAAAARLTKVVLIAPTMVMGSPIIPNVPLPSE